MASLVRKTLFAVAFTLGTVIFLPSRLLAQSRVVATIDGKEVDTVLIVDSSHRPNTRFVENIPPDGAGNTLLVIDGHIYCFDAAGYAVYNQIRNQIKSSRWIKDPDSKSEIQKILIVETK